MAPCDAGLSRLHWRPGTGACALAIAAGRMVRMEWPAMGEVTQQHLGLNDDFFGELWQTIVPQAKPIMIVYG